MRLREFLGLGFYISQLDKFLAEFRHAHPKLTAAQQKEKDKYEKIYALRDGATPSEKKDFWENF